MSRLASPYPTIRQRQVLDLIIESVRTKYYQPSIDEFCGALGVTRNAVHDHLKALERKGYLRLTGKARALDLHPKCFELQESGECPKTL